MTNEAKHPRNEVTHTPGPWKIHSHPGNITIVSEVGRDDLQIHYESVCNIPDTWETPREANARLIATAPELYSLAARVCFPDGGRDYTDAKEELQSLVLKLGWKAKIEGRG